MRWFPSSMSGGMRLVKTRCCPRAALPRISFGQRLCKGSYFIDEKLGDRIRGAIFLGYDLDRACRHGGCDRQYFDEQAPGSAVQLRTDQHGEERACLDPRM